MPVTPTLQAAKLRQLLEQAKALIPPNEFGGFGIIMYSAIEALPVLPLCGHEAEARTNGVPQAIAQASRLSNPCHDGFHLISQDGVLTHTNQYLAPPLDREALSQVQVARPIGARYLSALLGSKIPGVSCTGIVTENGDLVLFQDGKQVALP